MEELKDYAPILDYLFKMVLALGVYHFKDIKKSMESMTSSINELNTNMAVMFKMHETKDKEIEAINNLIEKIEEAVESQSKESHQIRTEYIAKIKMNEEKINIFAKKMETIENGCTVARSLR